MRSPTISKWEANELAKKAGINFWNEDSNMQDSVAMNELAAIAKLAKYKKPPNANGSTARYFFYHLLKKRKQHGWK